MCYARGYAYLQLREVEKAKKCFKEALMADVKCYDASYHVARLSSFTVFTFVGAGSIDTIQYVGRS